MGLHGAAGLGQLEGEGALHGGDVEAEQTARRGNGAEAAGCGGTEEAHTGACGEAESCGNVAADGHRDD